MSSADIMLFARAVVYCCAVRLALWFVPSTSLLRFVKRRVDERASPARARGLSVERIAWAVRAAGRRVPRATCLVEALTVQLLFARYGYDSDLRIGVARDASGKFIAHAWVEVAGRIMVGRRKEMRFTDLPDLGQKLGGAPRETATVDGSR